jgi:hypothetical protein
MNAAATLGKAGGLRVAVATVATFALIAVPTAPAADSLPDGRWALVLTKARPAGGALAGQETEAEETAAGSGQKAEKKPAAGKSATAAEATDVELVLERIGGKWLPLFSGRMDRPFGLVEGVKKDGALRALILFDAMGRSSNLFKGPGNTLLLDYVLTLRPTADGTIGGEWTDKTAGKGAITGRLLPMPRAAKPAPAPGEHPRFLLRADGLPALKTKAATPFGQSLAKHMDKVSWSRSGMAVGLATLYRISGDKSYAARAQELVRQDIRGGFWDVIGPIHDPPHKVMEAVYAWDLIHDACDPEFTKELMARLRPAMRFMCDFCDVDRGNGHPHSNWSAQFQTGVGMAALALLADPSDYKEPDPIVGIRALSPPSEPIHESVPVFPWDADATNLTRWLVAGPFDIGLGNDGLKEIGGAARAKVHDGLRFPIMVKEKESREVNDMDGVHYIQQKNAKTFQWGHVKGDDGQPLTKKAEGVFRKFPAEWICSPTAYAGWPGSMDLRTASGYRSYRTFYVAAALKVPEAVTAIVRFQNQQRDDPCVYIAGAKFRVNDVVRLEPGVYPVMHPVTYTTFLGSHGRDEAIYHGFSLQPAQPDQIAKMTNHRKAVADFTKRCRETLDGTPYADFWPRLWLACSRAMMDSWVTHAVSEGGWNIAGDCYTLPSLQSLAPYAHAYANAVGFTLGSPGHLDAVLPHQVHKTVFDANRAFAPAFGRGGGPYGPMPYARCFSFVDEKLKPAVGWAAHRTLELARAGNLKSENLVVDELDPMSAAFALLNWPLPEQCKPPEGILPLTAADRQRQCWTFRNRFKDGDDGVAALAGFVHGGGDWGDVVSGEFRLAGLGCEWAVRGSGGDMANVVQLADEVARSLRVRSIVYREIERRNPDGAACVTLDLVPLLTKHEWRETYGKPIGSRTLLTDFSGACGAPVLVVVQDQIPPIPKKPPKTAVDSIAEKRDSPEAATDDAGANEDILPEFAKKRPPPGPYEPPENTNDYHRWQFVADAGHKVAMRPDGFSLSSTNGATLNAVVLRPAKVRMWKQSVSIPMELNYRYDHRGGRLPRTVVTAGADESFLVVLTLQRGPAPPVSVADDRITVGGQKLRATANGVEIVPK